MSSDEQPPRELRGRVMALASQTPSPARDEVQRRALTWLLVGLALPWVPFVALGMAEQGPRPSLLLAATGSGTTGIALVALGAALGYGGRASGPPRARLFVVVLLLPLLLISWKIGCSSAFPGMTEAWASRPGLRCFGVSLLLGAAPLVAFLVARSQSDPVHPKSLGAALGAAGGLWAAALVDLWCPVAFPIHVVLGHALPALVLAVVGAVAGARVLATPPWTERS